MSRGAPPALAGAPLLVAHRGGAGLAPENTLEAFTAARRDWAADMIEMDVRLTADGACVVIHDARVDRTTDGEGDVASFTLPALRDLDAGYNFTPDGGNTFPFRGGGVRISTLDEVLETLPDMRFTIEVKAPEAQLPFFETARRHGAVDRIVAAGMHAAERTRFSEWPGARSASVEQVRPFYLLHRLGLGRLWGPRADVLQVPERWGSWRLVTPGFIRDAHRHGIAVQVWTVDDPEAMARLLAWGVDGIQSDRPDRLADVMSRRLGRPTAPAARATDDPRPPASME